jgi:hypothetical protein
MQQIETSLPGVYELRPVIPRDSRGAFLETYYHAKFFHVGIKVSKTPSFKTITPSPLAERSAALTTSCNMPRPSSAA